MDEKQRKLLNVPPAGKMIAHREGQGKSLAYLEGFYVIATLNDIFGPDGWERGYAGKGLQIIDKDTEEVEVKDRYTQEVTVKTRYTVVVICEYYVAAGGHMAEDVGFGNGISYHSYLDCYELAVKEAVTDAMKRCARSLGNAMGNCLYDKDGKGDYSDEPPPAPGKSKPDPNRLAGAVERTRVRDAVKAAAKKQSVEMTDAEIADVLGKMLRDSYPEHDWNKAGGWTVPQLAAVLKAVANGEYNVASGQRIPDQIPGVSRGMPPSDKLSLEDE